MFQRLCTPKTGLLLLSVAMLLVAVPTSNTSVTRSGINTTDGPMPLVRVAPTFGIVAVGDTTDVMLRVENAEDLFGVDLAIQFDPAKVRVLNVWPGSFAEMDNNSKWFTVRNWDNSTGQARFAATRIAPLDGVSGSGVLATVRFQGFTRTYSPVTFSAAASSMLDPAMAFIPFAMKSGGLFVGNIHQTRLPLTIACDP